MFFGLLGIICYTFSFLIAVLIITTPIILCIVLCSSCLKGTFTKNTFNYAPAPKNKLSNKTNSIIS
ncbi:hypothetical protein DEAC_c39500 [Desulfosporosinus acididurans]|uniref:Uncharacterized protein n=1 Tax=Desulfosporosinus acididurans TaxID=476652 RepID=A0A0J1FKY1_9FIRM|nr:hypothetical protein DEAC_c39500 [Desulfosporosinus acididurans]